MRKQWKQCQTLLFLVSKITADGDCSHEIKQHLLLGRKAMTNLERSELGSVKGFDCKQQKLLAPWKESYDQPRLSLLKSRDITLPTKVKAMVFPVVMYGCESWTMKKAECRRIDAFELGCWRRRLRVPWTATRSYQSILKEISPRCSLEGLILKLKLRYFGHLVKRANSLEKALML